MPRAFFLHNLLFLLIPERFPVFAVGDGSHVGGHGFFETSVDVAHRLGIAADPVEPVFVIPEFLPTN
jgi:hypothetical protein